MPLMSIVPVPSTTLALSGTSPSLSGALPFAMSFRCVNQNRPGYWFISLTGSAPPALIQNTSASNPTSGPDSFASTSNSDPSLALPNSCPWMWYPNRLPAARHCFDHLAKSPAAFRISSRLACGFALCGR
jgi:hypothetical protein